MKQLIAKLSKLTRLILLLICFESAFDSAYAATNQSSRSTAKPWLGIAIDKGKTGVLVKGIMPDTPAALAGLKENDEIIRIDGRKVAEPKELIHVVQASGIGQTVKLDILRDGAILQKNLKLALKPDEIKLLKQRLEGKPASTFDLPVIIGKEPGNLKKVLGRVVVVEFWATWCAACRATHKRLSEFAKTNPSIVVYAISDEDDDTLKNYARKQSPDFTILRDDKGKTQADWLVSAIPMIAVLDKDGRTAFVTVGAGDAVEDALNTARSLARTSKP
jgi:thiol-disulfide isomerase/thioredoxin